MKPITTSKRVGEIELWRAIFCLGVMVRHAGEMFKTMDIPFGGGAFGVEFFFIVSGYLMMASISKKTTASSGNLGTETVGFIGKKIGTFFPEMLVAFVIGFAVEATALKLDARGTLELFLRDPFEVFMLDMAGFGRNSINGVVWYLQSMLLCMMILYPLIRKYEDMMKKVVLPLVAVFLLGWLYRNYTDFRDPARWIDFTFKGNVRAMAELSLGVVAYPIVQWMKSFRFKLPMRLALTVLKWACWASLIAYMWKINLKYDFFFCFVFFVAIILAFSQQCLDAPLYQNQFVYWLGKMSLPYYLSHMFYTQNLPLVLPKKLSEGQMWAAYFGCTIVTTAVVYWAGKGIRLLAGKAKTHFQEIKIEA